jgi:hypothetical protein
MKKLLYYIPSISPFSDAVVGEAIRILVRLLEAVFLVHFFLLVYFHYLLKIQKK